MSNLWGRLVAAYKAFREPGLITDPLQIYGEFGDFDYRKLRYAIYWSFYENDAYRSIHTWASQYKISYGLYKYIRHIYNPAYRLGEFWKSHLWGGALDPEAGDGGETPSTLPILTVNPALRPAIAKLWRWSNWQINKDTVSLYGSTLGDAGLMVVDDLERQKVYLKFIHPGTIADVDLDDWNNVKAYIIEEEREDPGNKNKTVTYREEVSREGDSVIYRTYLNEDLYGWHGQPPEWEEPYGFIPLVLIQHNNVGLDWGWSEIHALRSKIHEVDDLASKLSDQIRKMVEAPWLFAGVDPPTSTPTTTETALTGSAAVRRPQPGREEMSSLYAPRPEASATPLVANLDIAAVAGYINDILAEIERELPELQKDIWTASGDASGRALRIARQRVETKVRQRRPNYDDALVRAQQMAIAIGGLRGYEGFDDFDLESFDRGDLDHSIGPRPVFANDPLDELELREREIELEIQEIKLEQTRSARRQPNGEGESGGEQDDQRQEDLEDG